MFIALKNAVIIPIHKKGDIPVCANYGRIALLDFRLHRKK